MESLPTTNNEDGNVAPALWSVAICGALVTVGAAPLFGFEKLPSVVLGAGLAVANLWAMSKLVRGFIGGAGRSAWGPVGFLKLAVLFVLLGFAVRRGLVEVLPLAFGYAALPLGIVLSQLKSSTAARGEN